MGVATGNLFLYSGDSNLMILGSGGVLLGFSGKLIGMIFGFLRCNTLLRKLIIQKWAMEGVLEKFVYLDL